MKHKSTPSTSTTATSSTAHSRPLTSATHHPLLSLLHLFLRSAALLSILAVALLLALAGWAVLRKATRVPQVHGRERVWLQYGEHKPPYATLELDPRKYGAVGGQRYDLSLELSVPVNENNLELGNFMVSLALVDGEGERVVNVSRPAILAHPSFSTSSPTRSQSGSSSSSSLTSLLNPLNLLRLPLSLLPSPAPSASLRLCTQKTQTLVVPLLEGVSLSSAPPATKKRGWSRRRSISYGAKVESVWIEVGRRDAHGADLDKPKKELQVYESYLRVETKLRGLRSLIHSHPLLSFTLFFPSFLLLELVAALLVYTSYVLKPDSSFSRPPPFGKLRGEGEGAADEVVGASEERVKKEEEEGEESLTEGEGGGTASEEEEQEEEDVKPLLFPSSSSLRSDAPSSSSSFSPTSISGSGDEGLDSEYAEQERMRRMRLGKGGRGMSEVAPPSSGEEEEEYEEEGEYAEEVEGVGRAEEEGIEGVEDGEGEKDDETATVGGSETTARTRSTFGPMSVATGTTLSSTSSGASGLRSRGNGGGGGGEEE